MIRYPALFYAKTIFFVVLSQRSNSSYNDFMLASIPSILSFFRWKMCHMRLFFSSFKTIMWEEIFFFHRFFFSKSISPSESLSHKILLKLWDIKYLKTINSPFSSQLDLSSSLCSKYSFNNFSLVCNENSFRWKKKKNFVNLFYETHGRVEHREK